MALAETRDNSSGALSVPRGLIYFTDKNGNATSVALNKDFPVIYAVPSEIQKSFASSSEGLLSGITAVARKISNVSGRPVDEIIKRLMKKNDQYELLIQKATADDAARIRAENMKGVYVKDRTFRNYPFQGLASHLLGFVSPVNEGEDQKTGNAGVGRYGLELYFNKELAGKIGQLNGGTLINGKDGVDLNSTIDINIQREAEDVLKKLIEEYGASGGTLIVEEPTTGGILAMTNSPDFDPNDYSKFSIDKFLNPAVQSVYEPGSIFKLITMSAGIDSGKITPETTYYDTGSFTANKKTITNWDFKEHGAYGKATMTNVIEHSINTGAVFAEKTTGNDIFYNYLLKFGINGQTGITLPGEVRGSINNLKHGHEIDFATAAYGQGVSVTPIELITAVSAIANGGVLMKPYILANQIPEATRRVISTGTSKAVTKMMISAVEKNIIAAIPNYTIAGKTGTAFIPNFGKHGYTDQVINSYIGFAPASDAKFIILIKLDRDRKSVV